MAEFATRVDLVCTDMLVDPVSKGWPHADIVSQLQHRYNTRGISVRNGTRCTIPHKFNIRRTTTPLLPLYNAFRTSQFVIQGPRSY